MSAFDVVRQFERRVAEFAGAKYAVAVNSGTSAIFLSLMHERQRLGYVPTKNVKVPRKTFISVPMAVMQAGFTPVFVDLLWRGVYDLLPFDIIDGALRFRGGMYQGGLHCLSFQARKILNIGEGGMILTDDFKAYQWLSAASYSGRKPPFYRVEDVMQMGWNVYMTPEKAARGLHLMEYVKDEPDQEVNYPDLSQVPLFAREDAHV